MDRYKFTLANNHYDRRIDQRNKRLYTLDDWATLVQNPVETADKSKSVYFYPFIHSGNWALKKHALALTHLVLDVDYNYTIDQFIADEHPFAYVLYSSYSHTDEHHKFRVVIPLAKPISLLQFDTPWFRLWAMRKFPYNDPATLKYQGFYIGATRSLSDYRYHVNRGPVLNLGDYKNEFSEIKKFTDTGSLFESLVRGHLASKRGAKFTTADGSPVVREYLSLPASPTGRGDISYRAIVACVAVGDARTLRRVIKKMRIDQFSDREIKHSIKQAQKYVGGAK